MRSWLGVGERGIHRLISLIAHDNTASQHVARDSAPSPAETVKLFDSGDAVVWVHPADDLAELS